MKEYDFWQLWQQYRDYLYRCCLRWMGGNPIEAEEVLSLAMLKAWEKVQQYAEKITDFKAWLTRLTHNLCVDIHRERRRSGNRVEYIEEIPEKKGLLYFEKTPLKALEKEEQKIAIRCAIDELPTKLRKILILQYYQEFSCQEIAQRLRLTVDTVYKRNQQAREILQRRLSKYLAGLDDLGLDFSDYSRGNAIHGIKHSPFVRGMEWKSTEAMAVESVCETISYQVSATCLEIIPQSYYYSHSLLGWF